VLFLVHYGFGDKLSILIVLTARLSSNISDAAKITRRQCSCNLQSASYGFSLGQLQ
jgi:hypothetical protein